jgi:hypothetical protein
VGNLLTPTLEAVNVIGTFDPTKNARYTAGGKRILNWLIYYDGATATLNKWMTPESDNNHLLDNDTQEETFITGNGTWTAKKSKFYDIWITGKGGDSYGANAYQYCASGGGGLTGKKRIYIEAGTVWTAVFSTASGGNTTFSDGVTTLSAQNGYIGGASGAIPFVGGAGGSASSGFDIVFPGGNGGGWPGGGGCSIFGTQLVKDISSNAISGHSYGIGATGAYNGGSAGNGGVGIIQIKG